VAIASRATTTGTGVNAVINVPTGTVDSDVLYLYVINPSTAPIATPSGWIWLQSGTNGIGGTLNVFRRVASSEPASYTLNTNGNNCFCAMESLTGVDNATPEDAMTTVATGTAAPVAFPSITTVTPDAWHLAVQGDWQASPGDVPTNYTAGPSATVVQADHRAIASAGTVSGVTSASTGATWVAISVAVRSSGAVPATGGLYDDRWRARPSVLTPGTSTIGTQRSAYPEDARDGGRRDALADYRSRDV